MNPYQCTTKISKFGGLMSYNLQPSFRMWGVRRGKLYIRCRSRWCFWSSIHTLTNTSPSFSCSNPCAWCWQLWHDVWGCWDLSGQQALSSGWPLTRCGTCAPSPWAAWLIAFCSVHRWMPASGRKWRACLTAFGRIWRIWTNKIPRSSKGQEFLVDP